MNDEQKNLFIQFCDNLLSFMRKNNWYGAYYATTAMMYAFAKKIGIDATPCIGECGQKGFQPFDHSWLVIDGKIYDLAISMPFIEEMAKGPVYGSIDSRTGKEVDMSYGISYDGLGQQAAYAYSKNLYDYLHDCPDINLISVLCNIAKYSKVYMTRKWLEQNLVDSYFVLRKNDDGNKSQDSLEKVLSDVNAIFGKVFPYNNVLLEKCNKKGYSPSYDEIFDFYITSHAMSFLKNFYYEYIESPGIFLNARCIIEGLAMKTACRNGYFDNMSLDLIKNQVPIIEYKQYRKFQECHDSSIIPDDIKDKFNEALDFFQAAFPEISKANLKKIASSPLPFACNPKLSFQKVVKDNLGDEWEKRYSILSAMVHPTSNESLTSKGHLFLLLDTLEILKKEYSTLSKGMNLKQYSFLIFSSKDAEGFIDSIKSECTDLESVIDIFNKSFGDNYVSNTFHNISMIIQEMAFDTVFGFTEQVKSKWKVLIELLSVFYEVYLNSEDVNDSYKLMQCHDNLSIARLYNSKEDIDEILSEAYGFYKSKYPNGLSKDSFDIAFEKTTGYTLDADGKTKSLTKLVSQLADLFKEDGKGLSNGHSIKLHYAESQMVSHANGYLWYANTGAWSDVNGLFYLFNQIMYTLCLCMSRFFKNSYKESKREIDKETSNVLAKAGENIAVNTQNLFNLLSKRTETLFGNR